MSFSKNLRKNFLKYLKIFPSNDGDRKNFPLVLFDVIFSLRLFVPPLMFFTYLLHLWNNVGLRISEVYQSDLN